MRVGDPVEIFSYNGREYRDFSIWGGEDFALVRQGRFWKQSPEPLPEPIFSPEGEWLAPSLPEVRALTDATLLRGDLAEDKMALWAEEMKKIGPRNVCVFPAYLEAVRPWFPHPATVISFPHGASSTDGILAEIRATSAGEIDLVAPLRFLGEDWKSFRQEMKKIASETELPLKVILETALWDSFQITEATKILADIGVLAVKTSTGSIDGASVHAVQAMRRADKEIEIKASGGIRSRIRAGEMIRAGATILGASNLQDWA